MFGIRVEAPAIGIHFRVRAAMMVLMGILFCQRQGRASEQQQ
jgi:hypothetical protein